MEIVRSYFLGEACRFVNFFPADGLHAEYWDNVLVRRAVARGAAVAGEHPGHDGRLVTLHRPPGRLQVTGERRRQRRHRLRAPAAAHPGAGEWGRYMGGWSGWVGGRAKVGRGVCGAFNNWLMESRQRCRRYFIHVELGQMVSISKYRRTTRYRYQKASKYRLTTGWFISNIIHEYRG